MSERETALKEQKRPTEAEIDMLEKVAWDANVDGALVWERDQRERLQVERDGYRGALVGLLPLLGGHPEILRKRINQALAAGEDPVPVCQWREIATAPKDGTRVLVMWEYWSADPFVAYFKHGRWNGEVALSECSDDGPTHWMPLPAPPVALVPAEQTNKE